MKRSWLVFIVALVMACSDSDKLRNDAAPVSEFAVEEKLDRMQLDGSLSTDPDNDHLTYTWSTTATNIAVKNGDVPGTAYFKLPDETLPGPVTVNLQVSDGRKSDISIRSFSVPPLTQTRSFGLGKDLTAQLNLDGNYEWYLDQANTGVHSLVNCGPTSVTMAIKWARPGFTGTPVDARNMYRSAGGWWYTNDIINYLSVNVVTNWTIALNGMQALRDELDAGNIAILCVDMYSIPMLSQMTGSEYHKDKFYETNAAGWGHFIVIKGYKEVDGTLFFEAYDPYSFGKSYTDHSLQGKNRYYTSTSLDQATQTWWDYAIIVSKASIEGGRRMSVQPLVHMPGQ